MAGVVAIVIALAVGAWAMQRFERIESEIARRLQAAEQQVTALDAMLGQSRDLLRDLQGRNAVLENKLAETAGLQAQVEKLFRDRAEDSFDVTLAEAESGLALAAQQLALGADVEAVLAAIQNIEARLARESDARLGPVRAVLARDIERLRVHPSSDVGRLALRLDALIAALDQLPLLATIREPVETANGLADAAPGNGS
ncbi:MAG: uroporphyrinogen-III C-methyltransferase, partial [Gammaproteobacteria bacterium]